MSEGYYQKNFIKRGWDRIITALRGLPSSQLNAISFAVGAFIVLIGFLEYKVFESMYGMTRDIFLSASALTVTAFGGILAETVLHRNKGATDDQLWSADALFYISLFTSAVIGFGIWAQATGTNRIEAFGYYMPLPDFASFAFVMITVVTVIDIVLLRKYIRDDVDAKHARNVSRSESKKREADLKVEDSLINFDAEVKRRSEGLLRVEKRRAEVRKELESLYGGTVPADIMAEAMRNLDNIIIDEELRTGSDINGDGNVGRKPKPASQPRPPAPQLREPSFASAPSAPAPAPTHVQPVMYSMDAFLSALGMTRQQAYDLAVRLGDASTAWKTLRDREMLPDGLTHRNFDALYGELMSNPQ